MTIPTSNPLGYLGIESPNPRDTFYRQRNPTINDFRSYKIGDRWINTQNSSAFILVSKTNAAAQWEAIGGGSTQMASLTPNIGGAIFPVAGNTNLIGTSGLHASGLGNTVTLDNFRDLSPFIVSAVVGDSEYSSIQAAINAAQPTGGLVIIKPGQYFENLTLQGGVSLLGLTNAQDPNNPQRVAIFGNVDCNAGSVFASLENIFFSATAAAPTLSPGAGNNINLSITNCVFFNFAGGDAVKFGMPALGGATLLFYNCDLYSGNDALVLGQNTNTQFRGGLLQPNLNAVNMTSICTLQMEYANVGGTCIFGNFAAGTFQFCKFYGGIASVFTQSAITTNCNVTTSTIESNSATTFFAAGIGAFRVGNCALTGSATLLDPGLTSTVYTSI